MKTMIPKKLILLDVLAALAILCVIAMVFLYAPVEKNMGMVQKVFYFHVAYAWIGMLSFIFAAISSAIYLAKRKTIYDGIAESSVEAGLVFILIAVATGSIWARPIWNTWWTWDPRLTTTSIMALIYIGYLFLRQSMDNPDTKKRFSAVYSIIGCLSVPLTFFSIRGARSIHPVVIGGNASGMGMTPEIFQTMLAAIFAFSLFFIAIVWHRTLYYRLCEIIEIAKEDEALTNE